MKQPTRLDVECYPNYFLISFYCEDRKLFWDFEIRNNDKALDRAAVGQIMRGFTTYGFNSIGYDLPMIAAAMMGMGNKKLKKLSDFLITSGEPWWKICKRLNIVIPREWDHFDLFEPSPGVKISLKLYAARIHSKRMQDLPYEPSTILTEEQMDFVRNYCHNDTDVTGDLRDAVWERIELRREMGKFYGVDLRSKSDAQVAEAIFKVELEQRNIPVRKMDFDPRATYIYEPSDWLQFKSPALRKLKRTMAATRYTLASNGKLELPEEVACVVNVNRKPYKVGIGGLHSQESCQTVVPEDDEELFEADFTSFYPIIIRNEGLYPQHLTSAFLEIYSKIIARRVAAKREGRQIENESFKIVLNGSFGKFGSTYSFLFAPNFLLHTTLTGQLSLLMLIEKVTRAGAKVVSANTDGIVILCKKAIKERVMDEMADFEMVSGFDLEYAYYKGLYSRDVNNYVAVKTNGTYKVKGCFAEPGLTKNPAGFISYMAVAEFFTSGTPIHETIFGTDKIEPFLHARKVTGGAECDGKYLGKVVRWYYSTKVGSRALTYVKSGNKVPDSDGAQPIMELPEDRIIPADVDYDRYLSESYQILRSVGYGQNKGSSAKAKAEPVGEDGSTEEY